MFVKAADARPEDYQAMALAQNMYEGMGEDELAAKAAAETVTRATRALQINPCDSRAMVLGAMAHHRLGNAQLALEWVDKAYALDPESASTAYNSACLFAGIGEIDRALDLIEVAIGLGSRNKRYFETDPDFESLKDHPRFKELLSRI
jgi:adenylate cyclase